MAWTRFYDHGGFTDLPPSQGTFSVGNAAFFFGVVWRVLRGLYRGFLPREMRKKGTFRVRGSECVNRYSLTYSGPVSKRARSCVGMDSLFRGVVISSKPLQPMVCLPLMRRCTSIGSRYLLRLYFQSEPFRSSLH
jgi:hypothetical protein